MGRIPEEIVSSVLERSDIVEVISGYIPLKRAGRNFKANCPFHHEKTPSFVVNPDKQIFHCFGCGVGGNTVSFVMRQENIEFPDALRLLASKYGIIVPEDSPADAKTLSLKELIYSVNDLTADFYHQLLVTPSSEVGHAVKYLKDRGITIDIVKKFKLGFAPDKWEALFHFLKSKNVQIASIEKAGLIVPNEKREGYFDRFRDRIIFPIFDVRFRCVGFGGRTMKEGMAKYVNSPETVVYTKGHHLYGFHLTKEAVRQNDFIVVVEGYMDFITPFQAGCENIVASLGTALTVDQIRLIRRYTHNVVMLFDADPAGENAMVRSLDLLIEEGMNVKVALLSENEDPDSFVRKYGIEQFKGRISQALSVFDFKIKKLSDKFDTTTPEGKAKICEEMLLTIQRFENKIIRAEYVKKLAATLNVSVDDLTAESKKVKITNLSPVKEQVVPIKINLPANSAEHNLLRLMLNDEACIPLIKEEVPVTDFRDTQVRSIINHLYDMLKEGKDLTVSSIMGSLKDQTLLQMISQMLTSEDVFASDRDKLRRDCILRIKNDRMKIERQQLLSEIRIAEENKNEVRLDELKLKFNQLFKEVSR